MCAKESKVADQGPFCVAIQDTPESIDKLDVLEAMKEFEPLDAFRVQENRWIVSLKTINNSK
ncbi:hypothetical protein CHS0354_006392 [Potamilus streckersoni]|uniref:Uncharacterized protein n=1 Tax=Potamilus streckersoni TaxID=2493646 RepID=A0AAE0WA43_9BIVA|nr:hypothetical protein CHS0354_006392 [Potamilus streckersoni]